MFLLKATAAIFILDVVLFHLIAIHVAHEFVKRYPSLVPPKQHWSTRLISAIQIGAALSIPLLNILFAYIFVFRSEEVVEKMYAKCKPTTTRDDLSPNAQKLYNEILYDMGDSDA